MSKNNDEDMSKEKMGQKEIVRLITREQEIRENQNMMKMKVGSSSP